MRKYITCIFFFLVFISLTLADNENAKPVKVDEKVKDWSLNDIENKAHTLKELLKKKKAVVLIFLATECPVVDEYVDRISKLIVKYEEKDIQFVGVHSNKHETTEGIKKYSEVHGFKFPILLDPKNKIADYFQARRTPEVFLIDTNKTLRYRGAIDDNRKTPEVHYLQNVINLILEGKAIPEKQRKTRAIGCTIKRVRKAELDRTP